MDWNKKTILGFINLIKERPAIWDYRSPEYKIKNTRYDALKEVAMMMGITMKEVNSKWTILRNQYSRERRKMERAIRADSKYTTKWYAFNAIDDLMLSNKSRNYNNSEEMDSSANLSTPQINSTPKPHFLTPLLKTQLPKKTKRETVGQSLIYNDKETVMRERKHRSKIPYDLTSFGQYIAANLKKYPQHLQCKAKYEINKTLFKIEMENLEQLNAVTYSSTEESSNPLSPKSNHRFSADDDNKNIKHENAYMEHSDSEENAGENQVIFLNDQYTSE